MFNRTVFVVLTGGMLLAASVSAGQRWGNGPVPSSGACFYQQPGYRGSYFCARSGEELPVIPNAMNNRIRSIRVFGGGQVVVYSYGRFDGAEHWINYNVPDLRSDGWYNRIGSARLSWEPRFANRDNRFDDRRPRGTSGRFDGRANRDNRNGGVFTREQAQAIVRSAYLNVLGREPDPASAGWVDRVLNDRWSQQQLENELRNSAEYRSRNPGR